MYWNLPQNSNQSHRRPAVQTYFPLMLSVLCLGIPVWIYVNNCVRRCTYFNYLIIKNGSTPASFSFISVLCEESKETLDSSRIRTRIIKRKAGKLTTSLFSLQCWLSTNKHTAGMNLEIWSRWQVRRIMGLLHFGRGFWSPGHSIKWQGSHFLIRTKFTCMQQSRPARL